MVFTFLVVPFAFLTRVYMTVVVVLAVLVVVPLVLLGAGDVCR